MRLATPLHRLLHAILIGVVEMRWSVALVTTLAHVITTYAGFMILGEDALVAGAIQFAYFYIVTGSTVGYGDFSPVTDGGKLFASLWVIPGAISIFAFLLGKAATSITLTMRSIMHGLGDFSDATGHVVVVGHVPGQTNLLLEEAKRLHGKSEIVIVSTEDISGQQKDWRFIRASSLSQRTDLERAGVRGAAFVVVLGRDDDESLAAAMAVAAMGPLGHVVAYFQEVGPAEIVEAHCPQIETVTSISVQMVARALVDPGAGDVIQALASTKIGATLYSTRLESAAAAQVRDIRNALSDVGASLIGYRPQGVETPILELKSDMMIQPGHTLYYIASARLGDTFRLGTAA